MTDSKGLRLHLLRLSGLLKIESRSLFPLSRVFSVRYCMKGHAYTLMLSEVQLLRVRVTFHTFSLFYLRSHAEITRQWKPTVRDETASVRVYGSWEIFAVNEEEFSLKTEGGLFSDFFCRLMGLWQAKRISGGGGGGGGLIIGFVCRLMGL